MIRLTKNLVMSLFLFLLIFGCAHFSNDSRDHEDVVEMLNVLTSFAQGALEDGCFSDGEQGFLKYLAAENPKLKKWFVERDYTIKAAEVANRAVILICYKEKALFEDTDCDSREPDKDYRNQLIKPDCKITMKQKEVMNICQ